MFHIKKSNKVLEDKAWAQMRIMLDREMPENKKKRRVLFFWLFSAAAVTALCWYAFISPVEKEAPRSFTLDQALVASSDGLSKSGSTAPTTIGSITSSTTISTAPNQVTNAPGPAIRSDVEVALDESKTPTNIRSYMSGKGNEQYLMKEHMMVASKETISAFEQAAKEADAVLSMAGEENSSSPRESIIYPWILTVLSPYLVFERELIYCALPMTNVAPPMKTNKLYVYGGLGISMETNPSNRGWMVGSDVTLTLTGKLDIALGLWHQRKTTTANSQAFLGAVNAVLPLGSESVVNVNQWTLPLSLRYNLGYGILPYAGLGYHRLSQINWHEFSAASKDVEQTNTTNENKDYFTALVRQNVNKNQFTWDAGFWWKISGRLHLKLNYSHRLDYGEVGLPSGKNTFALAAMYAIK
ncbi:MAG: outer membrane beta-barrel protein [Saprospiraceae bacterium]|nr:outer membrane beta-barrel protein [Saprospiraceae bacterium]